MSKRLSIRVSFANANGLTDKENCSNNNGKVLPEIFKHRLANLAEETLGSLQQIWKEAGYEDVECHRLLGDLLNKLKYTCTAEISAEQQILEHARVEVENKIRQYVHFSKQLGRNAQPILNNIEPLNYTDKLAELEAVIETISDEVSQRQDLMDVELLAIRKLAEMLDEPCPSNDSEIFSGPEGTPELSDVRLALMKQCRSDLEKVYSDRKAAMVSCLQEARPHVVDMMLDEEGFHTLEAECTYSSSTEYHQQFDEKLAIFYRTGEFLLQTRRQDLQLLQSRLSKVGHEKEVRRAQLAATGAEIARLWTLLRTPSAEREAFQASFKMNLSMATLSKGLDELARLKLIRTSSLGRVVSSIRNDILCLWEEAGIEDEADRRQEFPLYFCDAEDLDDSAVDTHEMYFSALRQRVENLKPILQKIARREGVVQERVELEHIQLNPERLTARGPNAREERKREEVMSNRVKNLDKLTKELAGQIQAWEDEHGPFIFMGERYSERIVQQEAAYIEIRENLRNARKKKDGKPEPAVLAPKTPAALSKKSSSQSVTAHSATLSSVSKPTPSHDVNHSSTWHVSNTSNKAGHNNGNNNNNTLNSVSNHSYDENANDFDRNSGVIGYEPSTPIIRGSF
mmetsp:Transcript_17378/g.23895  ORF Transcript_17378/g.23895 Transcript_17378/m.23895 type:complete len:628 (-) Transcript_17378:135-2018(-)|eukprot:CAMPEP_0170057914 /NCGR_PEP_ID=MMETSP0019_2-20121128/731_1 /TAXON_ID=98059 /ORGANISM="Dinobryon sp., Strain UTEXLB2267" /LENGTH=627 /DNA_ID=CAMNT_0010262719 /DNA_START=1465 /DNA_END=3348 /DNA_ORIENTATION=+